MIDELTKKLVNVQAYLPEDQEIVQIIKMCRLCPKADQWKYWEDGFGNHIRLENHKTYVRNGKSNLSYNEVYLRSHVLQVFRLSVVSLIVLTDTSIGFWMFCKDHHIRYFSMNKSENCFVRKSPLENGLRPLRVLIRHLDVETWCSTSKQEQKLLGLPIGSWITTPSLDENLLSQIQTTDDDLFRKLAKELRIKDAAK